MDGRKVVVFDIETLPDFDEAIKRWVTLSNRWGMTMNADVSSIICIGWKYLDEKKTHCINAWDYPKWKKDKNCDKQILKDFSKVLKDADAVITHNGKNFDWKFVQTRLLKNNLPVLPDILHIDTCKIGRANLKLTSNSLNNIGKFILQEMKLENGGWQLWVDVNKDIGKAKKLMERYCKQDVKLLEKVFNKLRPFVKGSNRLPNANLYRTKKQMEEGVDVCPTCGSEDCIKNGWRHSPTGAWQRYTCRTCGSHFKVNNNGRKPRV